MWLEQRVAERAMTSDSLEAIKDILNHEDPDTSIIYIEPWNRRINAAFKGHLQGVKMPESLKITC